MFRNDSLRHRSSLPNCSRGCMLLVVGLSLVSSGCQPQQATRPVVTQGSDEPIAADRPTREPASRPTSRPAAREATQPASRSATQSAENSDAPPTDPPIELREPKRPPITWAKFVEAFNRRGDADIKARWTGERNLEVQTANVRVLILDFRELPEDAPRRPPWNLLIDGQPIEITGKRGPFYEFTRTEGGAWNVTGPKRR